MELSLMHERHSNSSGFSFLKPKSSQTSSPGRLILGVVGTMMEPGWCTYCLFHPGTCVTKLDCQGHSLGAPEKEKRIFLNQKRKLESN